MRGLGSTTPALLPDLMAGFTIMLLCHNRPPNELLTPIEKDMSTVFTKEFQGLTDQTFSYEDHRATLHRLIRFIHEGLVPYKSAIIDCFELKPASSNTVLPDFDHLPAIQWKRQNLTTLRAENLKKFEEQIEQILQCLRA